MAIYRKVHTSFWQDTWVIRRTPQEKYFYLYLLTNTKTNLCGIYEIPIEIMILETGYDVDTINELLERFIHSGKIQYDYSTDTVYIHNWIKHNPPASPKIKAAIEKELMTLKNREFIEDYHRVCIEYGYSIDTPSLVVVIEREGVVAGVNPTDDFPSIPEKIKKRLRTWQHGSNAVWTGIMQECANDTPEEWILAALEAAENADACNWNYLRAAIDGIKRDGGPGKKSSRKCTLSDPAHRSAYDVRQLRECGCADCMKLAEKRSE